MSQVVIALAIVLAVIGALRALLRSCGIEGRLRGERGPVRVEASCPLGARQRLLLVEVEGERLLIGASESSLTLLHRLPSKGAVPSPARPKRASEPAARRTPGRHWARWLRRVAPALAFLLTAAAFALPARAAAPSEPASVLARSVASATALAPNAALAPERISTTLEIVAVLTVLSVAPAILLMATCFTRVVIVLSLLRQAIGIHQLPPNQVIVGLALAITFFVNAPLAHRLETNALDPYLDRQIDVREAGERARSIVRQHLLRFTREKDLRLFVSMAGGPPPATPEAVGLSVLLPAFMISELRTAFEVGFMIFLPFLIIDLVVASILISMQMIVLPPIVISLPFKLMLFVLLDGWNLVVGSLVRGLM